VRNGHISREFAQISRERLVQAQFLDQKTCPLLARSRVQSDVLQVAADITTNCNNDGDKLICKGVCSQRKTINPTLVDFFGVQNVLNAEEGM
jgi:hypothetical protein